MQQSNVIFAALFIAFIVYITSKGELPTYINLLKGKVSAASANTQSSTTNTNSVTSGAQNLEKEAEDLASQVSGIYIDAPAPPSH